MKIRVIEKQDEFEAEQLPDGRWIVVEVSNEEGNDEPWMRVYSDKKFREKFKEVSE